MKLNMNLLLAVMAVSTSASATTISFTQSKPPSGISTPITVKALGITGLEHDVKADGKFQIKNNSEGKAISTKVFINNIKDGYPQIAIGSIDWTREESGAYKFLISAGGNPSPGDPKKDYCVTVSVNGSKIGKNCTNHKEYWKPAVASNIQIAQRTNISVSFLYK